MQLEGTQNNLMQYNATYRHDHQVDLKHYMLNNAKENNATPIRLEGTFLDKQYTVFGEVTEGMDVADKIVNLPRDGNDCPNQEEAKIIKVTISD